MFSSKDLIYTIKYYKSRKSTLKKKINLRMRINIHRQQMREHKTRKISLSYTCVCIYVSVFIPQLWFVKRR